MRNFSLGIRAKLISIFILIKVLPLIALAWFAWDEIAKLNQKSEKQTSKMIVKTNEVVKGVASTSTQNSILALDDKSREAIEALTTNTAQQVASFLYDRDQDILLASELGTSEDQYRSFLESRYRDVILHHPWKLDSNGEKWIPAKNEQVIPSKAIIARNKDNQKDFNYRPPESSGIVDRRPLYLEMTFIDLKGNEIVKVTTSDLVTQDKRNVSAPENTYCRSESYFAELKKLQPGEIFVSDVIGEYVPGHMIGTYSKVKANARKIEFEPEKSGYAGKENPVGKRFQGIVRWAMPVVQDNSIKGYVTLALDHTHIMEFTDHVIPTAERFSAISDAGSGNYAFMWDYKGRNISHPRDYFIVGYDPETGQNATPWMDEEMYELYLQQNSSMKQFEAVAPQFKEQDLDKRPVLNLTQDGLLGLDCRYLNFAPQCEGWFNLTQDGGSGSFVIFWSGLWKLTTAATIPYYTGMYADSPRGFGFVTIGANVDEFHSSAIKTAEKIGLIEAEFTQQLNDEKIAHIELLNKTLQKAFQNLTFYTLLMIAGVIVIAIVMAGILTGRITEIINGFRRFQEGERGYRLTKQSNDEVGQLIEAYNEMANTVEKHISDVEVSKVHLEQLNQELENEVHQRRQAQQDLSQHKDNLEKTVNERTKELKREIDERKRIEKREKEVEERLLRAEKMEALGTMAGGVAHDLNNILSGIVSYPELLLMKLPQDSELRKPVSTIHSSGKQAAAIVQDLLTMARRGVATMEVVNLNQMIEDYLTSSSFEELLTHHPDITLEKDLNPALLNTLGSPAHLSKSIMNLVTNAVEAIPESGKVIISTDNCYVDKPIKGYDVVIEGEYIALKIEDTGTGITPDDAHRIFEPFYTKKKMGRSGTGLGMAVVWGTVRDHKGYIDYTDRQGGGSCFTIYFPVTRKSVESIGEKNIDDYSGKGESILVVDDIPEQREIATDILTTLGYQVISVVSGEEAVEYLKKNKMDLILLDMIMDPGMDGLDTYKQVLEFQPDQKVIIASGYSETERTNEILRLGASIYLKKPYTVENIATAVRSVLES